MGLHIVLCTVRQARGQVSTLQTAATEYVKRCGRAFEAELRPFKCEGDVLRLARDEQRRGGAALWLADTKGTPISTEQLAKRVRSVRDGGVRLLLMAIGPADGWSAEARAAADVRFSLGPMTLPHELAALVLAEQIYRVSTVLEGHPYHLGH